MAALEELGAVGLLTARSIRRGLRPPILLGTWARQVEALGYSARDVRHIVVTHLDPDHAGGLSDFPDAEVHIFRAEHKAAMERRSGGTLKAAIQVLECGPVNGLEAALARLGRAVLAAEK